MQQIAFTANNASAVAVLEREKRRRASLRGIKLQMVKEMAKWQGQGSDLRS